MSSGEGGVYQCSGNRAEGGADRMGGAAVSAQQSDQWVAVDRAYLQKLDRNERADEQVRHI